MRFSNVLVSMFVMSLLWPMGCKEEGGDVPVTETICDDGEDNDADGDIDCLDSDCTAAPICEPPPEICDNGSDDDEDGDTDCEDRDCVDSPPCEVVEEICDDGLDNDEDGDTDCEDRDCVDSPPCEVVEEICDDGLDNDEDGETDCDDSECVEEAWCIPPDEVCDNQIDDDGDGDADCDDRDCRDETYCWPHFERCNNGEDDDNDGLVDCDDSECHGTPECVEHCNGVDDNGDGRVDEDPIDEEIGAACYDGPVANRGVGICVEGAIECFGGELVCIGWVAPEPLELCDGLDSDCDGETPVDEAASGCSSSVTIGRVPTRIELRFEVRDADVQINLDSTGSMGGEIDTLSETLRSTIVPAIREALPTSGFGVSTFDDFPVGVFGSAGDEPFTLHQRITSNIGSVQAAIDAIPLHIGGDPPESGIESLYQIATGAGLGWSTGVGWRPEDCGNATDDDGDGDADCTDPDCSAEEACADGPRELCGWVDDEDGDGYANCDDPDCAAFAACLLSEDRCPDPVVPADRTVTTQIVEPGETIDAYSLSVLAGDAVTAQMFAWTAGSPLDSYLSIYNQADESRLALDDDECSIDAFVSWTAPADMDIVIYGHGYGDSTGWYAVEILVNDVPYVADRDSCSALEVGDEPFDDGAYDPERVVPLVPAADHYPIADEAACLTDCEALLGDWEDSEVWARRFCRGMPIDTCGDGIRQHDEGCDDGDTVGGDGCAADCTIEPGCGNALLEDGETCDDGNTDSGDGCSPTCVREPPLCGNGVLDPGEQCDDGGTVDGDGCNFICFLDPECGDGHLNLHEECDDGDIENGDGCSRDCLLEGPSIPPFDWEDLFDPVFGHGTIGGAGFRASVLPVIVHITDSVSHDCEDYGDRVPGAHCSGETFDELAAIGARVVAIRSEGYDTDPSNLRVPLGMVVATDSVVPLCAFDGSTARTTEVCAADQCCTGVNGAGVAPIAGECPLLYRIHPRGGGLDTSMVEAVSLLTRYARYSVTMEPRDDPIDAVDATCFIDSLVIDSFEGPPGGCSVVPELVDTDGDGHVDTLENTTPGTHVSYEIHAVNVDVNDVDGDGDTEEACAEPGTYPLWIDVIADGVARVATRRVNIIVP